MPDIINIKIEEDGTVSFETDGISGTQHVSADQFLKDATLNLGGKRVIKQKEKKVHIHNHNHVGNHSH